MAGGELLAPMGGGGFAPDYHRIPCAGAGCRPKGQIIARRKHNRAQAFLPQKASVKIQKPQHIGLRCGCDLWHVPLHQGQLAAALPSAVPAAVDSAVAADVVPVIAVSTFVHWVNGASVT